MSTLSDLAAVAALGTTPIAGANPAGVSARYEPEFEKLAGEIAKLESVEGRNTIKWDVVVENAIAVLGKSKDLLVTSYLTLGLLQEDGYAGYAAGLTATRDILNTFWENLFPEKARMRARSQAITWMTERVTPFVRDRGDASKSDKDPLTACVAVLEEIAAICGQKFEEGGPAFNEMQSATQDRLYSVPADAPPPSSEPAPSSDGGQSAPQAAEAAAPAQREIDSPDAARAALTEMRERRIKAAGLLREANPADPLPYRLLRAAVWEDLVEAPAAKAGVTELAGGDLAFAAQMEEKLEKGDYAGVIPDCEAKLAADRLWLDVNFFVHRAMEGLGKPYAAARRELGAAVVGLVRSCPTLLEIKFSDGTPMAGEPARLWILHELAALPGKAAAAAGGLDAAMAEARKLVARKNFPEAAALLQKESRTAGNRRDRFLGRFYLAKLCAEAGRLDLAQPQLEGLDEEARKFALDEWEPSLAAEIARELWRCHKSSPEKAAEFYGRLCRLDLGAALAVDGKK